MNDADPLFHLEEQAVLFDDGTADLAHDLVRVTSVGSWYLGTCNCGWKSKIYPDRWRVERQHRSHIRWERTPLDDRSPRT